MGQYVSLGTNLGELYDTSVAEIRLPISNDDLAYLESVDNPDTEVTLSASLAGKNNTWQGNIIRSEGVIDAENRMVYLVAEIKDPYLRANKVAGSLPLKYGGFVNAIIKGRTVDGIVKLPRYVVRNDQVVLVNDKNIVEIRHVNVVRSDLENVFIKDSLKTGERVATTQFSNMANGQLVKVLGEAALPTKTQAEDSPEPSIAATEVK